MPCPPDQWWCTPKGRYLTVMRVCLPLVFLVVLAACGSDRVTDSSSAQSPTSAVDGLPDATGSIEPDATATSSRADVDGADAESSAPSASTQPSVASSAIASSDALAQDCRRLADLEDADELVRWQVVNDGVMGGRSSAEANVVDSVLILAGEIVTDGGGFSSVRLALDEPLGEATSLQLRVRTDGRSYELTVADAAPGRDLRISHQGPIPAVGDGEWEEVAVDFDDLDASIFGQPVDVDPFEPGAATEVGIILADGSDGPFRFELDWIQACP